MKKSLKSMLAPGNIGVRESAGLLLLRVAAGAFMLTHGVGKLGMLLGPGPVQFLDPIGVGVTASLALAVFAEFFCSVFLILGLGTRFAAIPLLITMLVAGLIVHAPDPFARKELALLYSAVFAAIALLGPGRYSVDARIAK